MGQPPVLSSLAFLPGDEALAPAAGKQLNPEVAPGGGGYLAVWVDERAGITEMSNFFGGPAFDHHIGSSWDIYAARLDADGNLVDETPIIVAQQIQNQGMPDVAWNGQNWLVVWSGQVGMQCCPDIHMFAARVSPTGVVLDANPIVVDTDFTGNGLLWPCVTSDGNNWVVVWRDLDEAAGIFTLDGARIAPDGTLLDPGGVRLRRDSFNSYPLDPDIVWAADEYLLTWMENSGRIRGQRLAPDLAKIGGVFSVNTYAPSIGENPRVATNGADFFVTWWENRYYGWSQLAGARVSHAGVVLDPVGIALTDAYGYTNYEPAVDWDGSNYVVVYDKDAFPPIDLFAARVTAGGVVLDYGPEAIPVSTAPNNQWEAAVAHQPGSGSLVVWRDARHNADPYDGYGDIFAATFTPDGAIGPERCVALGAPRQTLVRLVPSGGGYLAVYRSETSPETWIKAQRLDGGGAPIDLEPVTVATGGSNITSPAAAWNGSVYLVVWQDAAADQVYGRRLGPDLTPIDAAPLPILPGNTPDVAAIGDVFLVVSSWEEPHEIRQIYSMRVRGSDGALLDGSPGVVGQNFSVFPRVAAVADRWLVVWERHPSHDNPASSIYANFVGANGIPGSYFNVHGDGEFPAVATGPDQAIIAWENSEGGASGIDIHAIRISAAGTFLGPQSAITGALNAQFDAAVAWDGAEYVAAFGDFRNDDELESHRGDVYGTRVSALGELLDPGGFAVVNDTIPEMFASVAGMNEAFVVGGSVFRQEAGYINYRIGLRSAGDLVAIPDGGGAPSLLPVTLAPNPTSGPTSVLIQVDRAAPVSVAVFDALGREVQRLHDGMLPAGPARIVWNGRDRNGHEASPGVYLVRAWAGTKSTTAKLIRW
jgi:hypothetical protein